MSVEHEKANGFHHNKAQGKELWQRFKKVPPVSLRYRAGCAKP